LQRTYRKLQKTEKYNISHFRTGKRKGSHIFWAERDLFSLPARRHFGGTNFLMNGPDYYNLLHIVVVKHVRQIEKRSSNYTKNQAVKYSIFDLLNKKYYGNRGPDLTKRKTFFLTMGI